MLGAISRYLAISRVEHARGVTNSLGKGMRDAFESSASARILKSGLLGKKSNVT